MCAATTDIWSPSESNPPQRNHPESPNTANNNKENNQTWSYGQKQLFCQQWKDETESVDTAGLCTVSGSVYSVNSKILK